MPDLDPLGCNAVLIANVTQVSTSARLAVHALSIITEETYQQLRVGGKADTAFPIQGVPVEFGADYEDFSENRRKFLAVNSTSLNYSESLSSIQTAVPAEAIAAWKECKLAASGMGGLHAVVAQVSEHNALVRFIWNPPPGVESVAVDSSSVQDGTALDTGAVPGQVFPPGTVLKRGAKNVTFKRAAPDRTILFSVNVANYACSESAPPIPTTPLRARWYKGITDGDLNAVRSLVKDENASVSITLDDQENQPLHLAAEKGKLDIVKFLVEKGASPDVKNIWGDTARGIALARHPNSDVAEYLNPKSGIA